MLYNIADHIYIGYMSGDGSLELVDVGVCMPLIMIISAFEVLIRSVGAPKVSIYMGKSDKEAPEKILGDCLYASIRYLGDPDTVLLSGTRSCF